MQCIWLPSFCCATGCFPSKRDCSSKQNGMYIKKRCTTSIILCHNGRMMMLLSSGLHGSCLCTSSDPADILLAPFWNVFHAREVNVSNSLQNLTAISSTSGVPGPVTTFLYLHWMVNMAPGCDHSKNNADGWVRRLKLPTRGTQMPWNFKHQSSVINITASEYSQSNTICHPQTQVPVHIFGEKKKKIFFLYHCTGPIKAQFL